MASFGTQTLHREPILCSIDAANLEKCNLVTSKDGLGYQLLSNPVSLVEDFGPELRGTVDLTNPNCKSVLQVPAYIHSWQCLVYLGFRMNKARQIFQSWQTDSVQPKRSFLAELSDLQPGDPDLEKKELYKKFGIENEVKTKYSLGGSTEHAEEVDMPDMTWAHRERISLVCLMEGLYQNLQKIQVVSVRREMEILKGKEYGYFLKAKEHELVEHLRGIDDQNDESIL